MTNINVFGFETYMDHLLNLYIISINQELKSSMFMRGAIMYSGLKMEIIPNIICIHTTGVAAIVVSIDKIFEVPKK
jgi:hypothetical protein